MGKRSDKDLIQSTGYTRWFVTITVVLIALMLLTAFRNDITAQLALTLTIATLILNFINPRMPQLLGFFLTMVAIGAILLLIFTGFNIGYVFSLLWPTAIIFIGYAYLAGAIDILRGKIFDDWGSGKPKQRGKATRAMRLLYVIAGVSLVALVLVWLT